VAISTTTSTVFPVFLTGALAVQVRQSLKFSIGQLGILVAVFFASAAIVSLASGSLAERAGGPTIMRICVSVSSLSMASISLFVHSISTMIVILAIAGMANGANQPAANLFVIHSVNKSRRGFALGVKQAAIPVATLLAGLAVPSVALTIGWRYAYAMGALFALLVVIAIPREPHEGERIIAKVDKATRPKIALAPILMLTLAMAIGAGVANALGAFLVENAVHAHWTPGNAGLLGALGSATSLISRLAGGYFADRRGGRHLVVIATMLCLGSIGYLGFATGLSYLIVPATVIGYAAGWGWNGVFNFAIIVNHPGAEGRATGTTQSGAFVGSVVGPLIFGYVVDHNSFGTAWAMASIAGVVAALLMLVGRGFLLRERNRLAGDSVTIIPG
ncbi:unnamed protein product, partial [Acidithrix sp. C25]